jgi:drug/metabolite transporter (DMT)-like permease
MQTKRLWLVYALITTVAWGIWGAFIYLPAEPQKGVPDDPVFPATLGYIVWSLTMIPPALIALALIRGRLDCKPRDVLNGMSIGLLGAAGQLVLFPTLSLAPAHLVWGVVALSPVITITLAALLAGERVNRYASVGIVLAIVAGVLLTQDVEWFADTESTAAAQVAAIEAGVPELSAAPESTGTEAEENVPEASKSDSSAWVLLSLLVFVAWGVQGYLFSSANRTMQSESIFFYMMIAGLLVAPVAWRMTDFSNPIDWSLSGPGLAAAIHILNAVGALLIVYAFRYGKAMLVSPLTNAGAPALSILISLFLSKQPTTAQSAGLLLAVIAALLMAIETGKEPPATVSTNQSENS